MPTKQKKQQQRPQPKGLKLQQQRQATRRAKADMYRQLYERVRAKEGGPEKVYNAAVQAGEAKGLSLSSFKRNCSNPELIGKEWEWLDALPAQCDCCFDFGSGEQVAPHLIYACKTQADNTFPNENKVSNVLVSNTESGFQNTGSWLAQLLCLLVII